jgi:eukaryotic-like serine/threonine-protein kinase
MGVKSIMSKLILSISALIVITSCLSLASTFHKHIAFAQQTTNLLTYENSSYGIKIQYPSTWEKQENGTKQGSVIDAVSFLPPTINSNASLDISIDDISDEKGITLAQYANNSIRDLTHSLKDFKLISSNTNSVLAGLSAYKWIYTHSDENKIFKDLEVGAMKGDKVYILAYEAGLNEYDKYLPTIQQLTNIFQITN